MYNRIKITDRLLIIFYAIILISKMYKILYITVSNVFETLAVDHIAQAIAKA